jgi:hypothetical protein
MGNKHTPAPWKAHIDNCQNANVELSDGHCIYVGSEEQDIDTIDANARLIAAAPDLLEALQNLWGVCDANNYEVPMGYRNQIFAAIAKPTNCATRL